MILGIEQRVAALAAGDHAGSLRGRLIGLEKESLRVSAEGKIAQTPHPPALGSALTHPYITTDYSEALLELITPPLASVTELLEFLRKTHVFVYQNIGDEFIWATSMPCVIAGDASIPIARYGSSNAGRMKHIYRQGLGHRYGRTMQAIAGTHFNYSYSDEFWHVYRQLLGMDKPLRQFVDEQYFCLIRNLLRVGWVVPYLFGASPAVCASFFAGGKPPAMQLLGKGTYYEPFATSLRLGDIGYQNKKEVDSGVRVCYDDLQAYVKCLRRAISTPHPRYEAMGVKVDGEYRQLNSNILQIENEYYSSVRPKQIVGVLEKPVNALAARGVRYLELRSPDVDAFEPVGIGRTSIIFFEALLLYCLLGDSPTISDEERAGIDANLAAVAHRGRDPQLRLQRAGAALPLRQWGLEICEQMQGVCALLDRAHATDEYSRVLQLQREKFLDPQTTPSARMLAELNASGESFFDFALRKSLAHQAALRAATLAEPDQAFFRELAATSQAEQRRMETEDSVDLDTYLQNYFAAG